MSLVLCGTFIPGIYLLCFFPGARFTGAVISLATLFLMSVWRHKMWTTFRGFFQSSLKEDLGNIDNHYGSDPSGFWVAEVEDGDRNGEIVGCVGLGTHFLLFYPIIRVC